MALTTVLIAAILVATALAPTRVRVHRYSSRHLVGEVTVRGRGLYFSRTPDGAWWRLRLRSRIGCRGPFGWPGDDPPDADVREPRVAPPGSGTGPAAVELPD